MATGLYQGALYYYTTQASAPATPSTGDAVIYFKTDKLPYYKNDAGTEVTFVTAAAAIADTRVAYSSSGVLTGDADLTFNGTTLTVNTLTVSTGALTLPLASISATGVITSFMTDAVLFLNAASAGTNRSAINIQNTGGRVIVGIEGSGGGGFLTGSTAYATIIAALGATVVQIGSNDTLAATFNGANTTLAGTLTVSGVCDFKGAGAAFGVDVEDVGNTNNANFVSFTSNAAICGQVTRVGTTSVVVYTTTSDHRAKDILSALTPNEAETLLRALNIYNGQYIGDTYIRPMFVADEVALVTPWAVTGGKDAIDGEGQPQFQQIALGAQEALLIAGWKALDARVSALEAV